MGKAKLDFEAAEAIRSHFSSRTWSYGTKNKEKMAVAASLGVSMNTIERVLEGSRWNPVDVANRLARRKKNVS